MASGSASGSTGTKRKAEETPVREFEERSLTNRYMEDLFEDVPYIDPMDNDQNAAINSDQNDYVHGDPTTTTCGSGISCASSQGEHPILRRDVTILVMTTLQSLLGRLRHGDRSRTTRDRRTLPYMDMDANNNDDDVFEGVTEDAADQVPVEEVGEQITPRPHDPEQVEVPTMLDEVAFHGADLAGGEGEIPLAILRVTDPSIRREVRNAHYN